MVKPLRYLRSKDIAMTKFEVLIRVGLAGPGHHAGAQIDPHPSAGNESFEEITRTTAPLKDLLALGDVLAMELGHLGMETRLNPPGSFVVFGHPVKVTL